MSYANLPSHILLVEDDQAEIDLVTKAIQKTDPAVHLDVARDDRQVLAYLEQWESSATTPVLILLDVRLPQLSGLQVLQLIKTHPLTKIVPVVMLSASGENEHIQQAYKLGANSYIMKSMHADEFGETLALIYRYWCKLNVRP